MHFNQQLLRAAFLFLLFLSSCAKPPEVETSTPYNKPYCSDVTSYSSAITVTGSATFQARMTSSSGLGAPGSAQPIRNAEVRIFDSFLKIAQCGETDSNGNFSLSLPKKSESYQLQIVSRANNDKIKVSVLKSPNNTEPHYISKSFNVSSSNVNLGTINAPATGNIEGGAFNIMDQIWEANEFLRQQTDTECAAYGCSPFTVAPLVTVYWDKGVNPGSYFGIDPVSFYIPSQKSLYLLGGSNGDVNNSDTDHFDNSVVLHEYGHFIEHQYADTDSPGGSHIGNSIIDARLAWGEGWAHFFQAAISGNPIYRDTTGNTDGATQNYFDENLETPENDIPSTLGEGNFREFAITRTLWDLIDPHPVSNSGQNGSEDGSENATIPFAELWAVFTGTTNGFKAPGVHYRNAGYFYSFLLTVDGGSNDIASVLVNEKQRGTRQDYGQPVSAGSCSAISILGVNETVSESQSNQFKNNDFYEFTHSGGSVTLSLEYTQQRW